MSSGELLGDYDLKNIVQNRDGYREMGKGTARILMDYFNGDAEMAFSWVQRSLTEFIEHGFTPFAVMAMAEGLTAEVADQLEEQIWEEEGFVEKVGRLFNMI